MHADRKLEYPMILPSYQPVDRPRSVDATRLTRGTHICILVFLDIH